VGYSDLLKLVEMLQPRENDLLGGLLDLAGQEDFVEDGIDLSHSSLAIGERTFSLTQHRIYLIEIEDQIQFTHIPKELIQHLDEEMYRLQICQLIVVLIYTRTEEQTRIATVDDLEVVTELDEVGLVFLVARGDEAVDLAFQLLLFVVVVRAVPFG
jgi:hypothetical protein